jgi:hypothetical protein
MPSFAVRRLPCGAAVLHSLLLPVRLLPFLKMWRVRVASAWSIHGGGPLARTHLEPDVFRCEGSTAGGCSHRNAVCYDVAKTETLNAPPGARPTFAGRAIARHVRFMRANTPIDWLILIEATYAPDAAIAARRPLGKRRVDQP